MNDRSSDTTRRGFLAFGAGALVVASVPLAMRTRPTVYRRTLPVMGTIAEVIVVHDDAASAHAALDAAFAELTRIEQLMTRYSRTSDVGRVNHAAAHAAVPVSGETAAVVLAGLNWAGASDGRFDPGLERITSLWNVEERRAPPGTDAVRRLAGRELYRALELGVRGGQPVIVRHDSDVGIDLGGIAKGYAIDRAGEVLRHHGMRDGIVKVGGDLVALGASPGGGAWRVGIRSPESESVISGEVEVSDAAVATSGDYQRYFVFAGVRYHHLMDPATASPRATGMHSITVRAASCMHADAAATACYGLDSARARHVLSAARVTADVLRTL